MKFPRAPQDDISIELTPLIDVVFLLLIFFMVSTTFTKESRLQITLPQASSQPVEAIKDRIEVLVTAGGEYAVNGRPLVNAQTDTLRRALQEAAGGQSETPLVISADAKASHQAVVTVMDVAGQLGLNRQRISTLHEPD